tara:strand:+ start:12400 stop:12801 length:402 start_codon:yes stop_codon:yes gene_type:complete
MKVVLNRLQDTGKEFLGKLTVHDELKEVYNCKTLELPWKNNKQSISCIARGEYLVVNRFSSRHKEHFILADVEGRSYILIHSANYHHELRGCITVGKHYTDLDGDGELDVTSSRDTLDDLLEILPDSFNITII